MSALYIDLSKDFVQPVDVKPGDLLDTGKGTATVCDLAQYRKVHGQEAASILLANIRQNPHNFDPRNIRENPPEPDAFGSRINEIINPKPLDEAVPIGPKIFSLANNSNPISAQSIFAPPAYKKLFTLEDAQRIAAIPALEPLRQQWCWVLWRWTLKPGKLGQSPKDWDKPPFQISDPTKNAANNKPLTWGKFEDACRVAIEAGMSGIGFCLPHDMVAFDLDKCLDKNGVCDPWGRNLIEDVSRSIIPAINPWTREPIVEQLGCYCEKTPSGTGLRVLGYGRDAPVKHKEIPMPDGGKLEIFRGVPRYLTLTGDIFQGNDGAFKSLDGVNAQYQAAETVRQGSLPPREKRAAQPGDRPWSPEAEDELRDALSYLDADSRDNWFRYGGAIYELGWDDAREIWDDWSKPSNKFDAGKQDETWNGFANRAGSENNAKVDSIFYEARACGWRPESQTIDIGPGCGMCVESINADPCDNGAQENDIEDVADDSPEEGEHAGKPASDFDNFRADAERGQYWYLPADALWPAKSVNARLPQVALLDQYGQPARYTRGPKNGEVKKMPASVWLDRNSPVQSLTWAPGYPQLIPDRIFKLGGFIEAPGNVVLNRYQPPTINITHANFRRVDVYVEHWHWLYPDDADHCLAWQAQKVQHPEIKINHCLLLGGVPGIGKDLALVPLSEAVGVSNFISLSPKVLLEKWTYFRKAVILHISEVRDLGDKDRFELYETMKDLNASPPRTLEVNEKRVSQYFIMNLLNCILTSNYRTDSIYLPPNDRRTYAAWSEIPENGLSIEKRNALVSYYNSGGYEDITAYLRQYPLAKFDPYAAPKKTEAFWAIANAHQPNEVAPLIDALDQLGNPLAVTIEHVKSVAGESSQITKWLTDPKNSRAIPYRFEACGYIPHRNPDAKKTGGLWTIQGKQQVVYVQKELEGTARNNAVEALRHETTGVTQARMRDGVARREAEAAAMSLERAERAAKEDGGKVLTFRPPSAWAPGPDPIQEVDFS